MYFSPSLPKLLRSRAIQNLELPGKEAKLSLLQGVYHRWPSWRQNPTVYSLMIHLKSLNLILNVFFEIEILPSTTDCLKIRPMPMILRSQLL